MFETTGQVYPLVTKVDVHLPHDWFVDDESETFDQAHYERTVTAASEACAEHFPNATFYHHTGDDWGDQLHWAPGDEPEVGSDAYQEAYFILSEIGTDALQRG